MERMTVEQALRWMNIALKEASFICPSEDHQKCKPCARRRQALATIRAELDGLRADAERYRTLRKMHCTDRYTFAITNPTGNDLDFALDAARQQESSNGQ